MRKSTVMAWALKQHNVQLIPWHSLHTYIQLDFAALAYWAVYFVVRGFLGLGAIISLIAEWVERVLMNTKPIMAEGLIPCWEFNFVPKRDPE